MTYKEFKKVYKWLIKQAPEVTSLYGRDETISHTETTYIKRGGRWHETETKKTEVNTEFYLNTFEAVPFFRNLGGYERITKAYTKRGLIPVEVVSISPDKNTKIVRTFKF